MKKNEELNAFFGRDMDNNESASPIVVLYNNIIQNFSNSRPEFRELHEEAIKKNLIKDNIRLLTFPEPMQAPCIHCANKEIILHEDFLSFLWGICYFIFFQVEAIHDKKYHASSQNEIDLNHPHVSNAYELFQWSITLLHKHSKWDTRLPNPHYFNDFSDIEQDFIIKTNGIFTTATTYLLFHEFAHTLHEHCENYLAIMQKNTLTEDDRCFLKSCENDADSYARRIVHNQYDDEITKLNTAFGIICVNLSLLFLINSPQNIVQLKHPDIDSRILFTFHDLSIEDESKKDYLAEAICNTCVRFFEIHSIPYAFDNHYRNRDEYLNEIFKIFDRIK